MPQKNIPSAKLTKTPFWWPNKSVEKYHIFINFVSVALAILTIYIMLTDQPAFSGVWVIPEIIMLVILTYDYVWHLINVKNKKRWFFWHIFDLLSLIPVSGLQSLRLLRVVSLFSKTANRYLRRTRLLYVYYIIFMAVIVSAEVFSHVEHTTFGEAFYWAIVTFSTSGYGDIVPTHHLTRILSMMLMLMGISTIGIIASSVGRVLTYDPTDELIDKISSLQRKLDKIENKNKKAD